MKVYVAHDGKLRVRIGHRNLGSESLGPWHGGTGAIRLRQVRDGWFRAYRLDDHGYRGTAALPEAELWRVREHLPGARAMDAPGGGLSVQVPEDDLRMLRDRVVPLRTRVARFRPDPAAMFGDFEIAAVAGSAFRIELRFDADLNIRQFGVAFARGPRDFGLYLGPALNLQVERGASWRWARPNPLLRLLVPKGAPRWSLLSRRERVAALERAEAGRLDLVRFASGDAGLDRPVWVARGAEVVVVPRSPGDRPAVGRDCVAVGLDQDTGCSNADRWLDANAYMLRKLSAELIDVEDFLALSWHVQGRGFARAG